MFLDSVDRSEVHVTVGGELCEAIITGAQAAGTVSRAFLCNNLIFFLLSHSVHMSCTKGSSEWSQRCQSYSKCEIIYYGNSKYLFRFYRLWLA